MGGKKTHDTILGALVSIGIITTIFLYIVRLSIQRRDLTENPVLTHSISNNFYNETDEVTREGSNFDFALAVANINLDNASFEETFENVRVRAYARTRNYDETKVVNDDVEIKLVPCTDFKLELSGDKLQQNQYMQVLFDSGLFLCPALDQDFVLANYYSGLHSKHVIVNIERL